MKDDPTMNRHIYVFNDDVQRWVKTAGSSSGAIITDTADFYKASITTVYTYDGTNLSSTKSYLSDATAAGSAAKLTTYSYSGSQLTKVVVTDSTV
jgi:predicted membrane-bound spermidine synthase